MFGDYKVRTLTEVDCADFTMRTFLLIKEVVQNKHNRYKHVLLLVIGILIYWVYNVRQLQFLRWPDKKTPEHAFSLLNFRQKVLSFKHENKGPLVVHCR